MRLVVDKDLNVKFRLERVKGLKRWIIFLKTIETKEMFQFEIIMNVFPIHLNTYVMGLWL